MPSAERSCRAPPAASSKIDATVVLRTVAHAAEAGTEASHAISETAGPTLTVTAETKLSFPDAVVPSALKSSTSG